jgi:plastocyanin
MQKRHISRIIAIALTSTLLFGASAVGITAVSLTGSAGATTANTLVISNFMFKPMTLKVAKGATVKVTNKDMVVHTVTSTNGSFKTGNIAHNQTKTFKAPKKAGTYHYFCSVHTFMTGTIIVK